MEKMLSLPAGTPVKRALDVSTTDFAALLKESREKKLSCYIAICIRSTGTEEGTVLLDEGKVVGCAYEYYKHNKMVEGGDAFKRVLNATGAKQGVIDVFKLTSEQVQLALVVNQKMVFVPIEQELFGFKTKPFSDSFEKEITGKQEETKKTEVKKEEAQEPKSSSDILKKYGIGEIKIEDESTLTKMEND
ncbi:MAG: DUF2226 domain-containing protein [Candidatus Micrarchaeota archaeon]